MTEQIFPEPVVNRIVMQPEKFGQIGSYCKSTLQVTTEEDRYRWLDGMLVKFTMNVMSGRTISEHPEVTFCWWEYTTWWDHFKQSLWDLHDRLNERWQGFTDLGVPPWLILLWPFLVLYPKWDRRHPVNKTPKTIKRTVNFEQRILYPQMDHIPPEFGHPVIYETLEMAHPATVHGISYTPSRFLDKHEVMSAMMRDTDFYNCNPAIGCLNWLDANGVNTSQLVKRSR